MLNFMMGKIILLLVLYLLAVPIFSEVCMVNNLKELVESHGDRMAVVQISRIAELQAGMTEYQSENELPWFADWLIENRFLYDTMAEEKLSVIALAMPRPAYADVIFTRGGKEYNVYGVMSADFGTSMSRLMEAVNEAGFDIVPESRLPLKRLAVQSGLAKYGRNNIAYIEGMGCKFNLQAFYTNIPIAEDKWREMVMADECAECDICVKVCPTGAIREDSFILDSHKCLVFLNESPEREIPDWVPASAHHTMYGCLKCQMACPMNEGMGDVLYFVFNEEETERVLAGRPYDDVSDELKAKLQRLGIYWYEVVPRNLLLLFDLMDEGHLPSLGE